MENWSDLALMGLDIPCGLFASSDSLAIIAAMRRFSSFVIRLAALRLPASSS